MDDKRTELQIYEAGIKFGQRVAALLCLTGVILTILGLTDSIEWLIEASGLKSKLINAGPGALFVLIGAILLHMYKPRIKYPHDDTSDDYEDGVGARVDSDTAFREDRPRKRMGRKGIGRRKLDQRDLSDSNSDDSNSRYLR